VNPYRGCEHGCIYCFARPTHAYWDLSPGIDFETRLIAKTNLAERLEEQLSKPGYVPQPIALGINTDAYQPIEREQRLTRQALEILEDNCQGEPYSFFDTHPPTPERVSELRKRFG
jgi:DNA repair photolyase